MERKIRTTYTCFCWHKRIKKYTPFIVGQQCKENVPDLVREKERQLKRMDYSEFDIGNYKFYQQTIETIVYDKVEFEMEI